MQKFSEELRVYGEQRRFNDVERVLCSALAFLGSAHQSLVDAADKLGFHSWSQDLVRARKSDPLLYYLWQARNDETHAGLVKWQVGYEAQVVVVDAERTEIIIESLSPVASEDVASRLFYFLYDVDCKELLDEKMKAGAVPDPARLDAAGVRVVNALNTLVFVDFTVFDHGKPVHIAAPRAHLSGQVVPSAFTNIQRAHLYYLDRLRQLQGMQTGHGTQRVPT